MSNDWQLSVAANRLSALVEAALDHELQTAQTSSAFLRESPLATVELDLERDPSSLREGESFDH